MLLLLLLNVRCCFFVAYAIAPTLLQVLGDGLLRTGAESHRGIGRRGVARRARHSLAARSRSVSYSSLYFSPFFLYRFVSKL